jgi:GR25 family glycosyltransferase involved in LPS biosynthesis
MRVKRLALGIVAHESREEMATDLATETQALLVSVDTGKMGCTANHLFVWGALANEPSTWTIVLEDDAQAIAGFPEHLQNALTAAPAPVVSLYLGKVRPPQYQQHITDALAKAQANDAHWLVGRDLLHAVGVAIRTELVPDMLANIKGYLPIDQSIGRWARKRLHPIAYVVPSLVNHRDGPTLVDHPDRRERTPGRVAHRFGSHLSYNSRTVELCGS